MPSNTSARDVYATQLLCFQNATKTCYKRGLLIGDVKGSEVLGSIPASRTIFQVPEPHSLGLVLPTPSQVKLARQVLAF